MLEYTLQKAAWEVSFATTSTLIKALCPATSPPQNWLNHSMILFEGYLLLLRMQCGDLILFNVLSKLDERSGVGSIHIKRANLSKKVLHFQRGNVRRWWFHLQGSEVLSGCGWESVGLYGFLGSVPMIAGLHRCFTCFNPLDVIP
jgi:hypothetical protein